MELVSKESILSVLYSFRCPFAPQDNSIVSQSLLETYLDGGPKISTDQLEFWGSLIFFLLYWLLTVVQVHYMELEKYIKE